VGILDKNERIVDIVLTAEGKRQLSLGELEFKYFCLFDDEVDYDPYVAGSGSLTEVALDESRNRLIEDTFVFEAVSGVTPRDMKDRDNTACPRSRLFDMPQGLDVLPRMTYTPDLLSGTLEVRQAVISSDGPTQLPAGVVRQSPTVFGIDFDVVDGFVDSKDAGVLVRVFSSGSEGLQEILPAKDYSGDVCYALALKAYADEDDAVVRDKIEWYEGGVKI
jgi:hypothetical protein